ncbi:Transmembrane protein adipocyte-associated 1 [Homalodisca vitripennis]|nr:Transmembrane protein adipocyte-associated 1 [Homalodisca vitripennis]
MTIPMRTAKKSFYLYVLFLALLNISQSVGSGLLLYGVREGLCVVDVTTCIYFTFFTPLVYHTFLSEFFGVSQPSIMFSYKAQVDDTMEDDTVSLPHQQSFSSLKTDSDYIYQDMECGRALLDSYSNSEESLIKSNSVYDSTQFDSAIPAPLYNTSLQSPDSITGYSLDSQTIDLPSGKHKFPNNITTNIKSLGYLFRNSSVPIQSPNIFLFKTEVKVERLVDNVIAEFRRPFSWCIALLYFPRALAAPSVLPRADVDERKTSLEIVPISKISNSRGANQKYKLNCNGKAIMYRANHVMPRGLP